MSIPKLGLITVSLSRERTDLAEKWDNVALQKLIGAGLEVLHPKKLALAVEETVNASKELKEKNADCLIYLIGTWIYAPQVVTAARKAPLPFILWCPRDPLSFSLVGAAITHGSLDELGIKHKYLYGSPEDPNVVEDIVSFARAAMVVRRMDGARLGLIGGKSMGMYTAMVDMTQVKDVFGVEIEHVDQYRMILEAEKVSEEAVRRTLGEIKREFGKIFPPEEKMMKSIRLYHALKKIVDADHYDFIAVKCQPEVINDYVSCCLPVALLNDDGLVTACECDLNAALTMQMLHILADQPVLFADVNDLDLKTGVLRLVNCGAVATRLAKSRKDVDWGLQYEYMGRQQGCTTVFCCRPGRVTLARLGRIRGKYVMLIAVGEAFEQPKERFKETREVWPHAFIRLDGDPAKFFHNNRSNHIHMVYGDFEKELIEICELLGIEPITI